MSSSTGGKEIEESAAICVHCGVETDQKDPPALPISKEWEIPVLVLSYMVALALLIVGWVTAVYQFVNDRVVHGIILAIGSTVITLMWVCDCKRINEQGDAPVPAFPVTTITSQSNAREWH